MIEYVPFETLTTEQLQMVARSIAAAPEGARMSPGWFMEQLQGGYFTMFSFPEGMLVVSTRKGRLCLQAWVCDNPARLAKTLMGDLKRLATDWQCDTIETKCFDPKLASVICRLGGTVESQTTVVNVE